MNPNDTAIIRNWWSENCIVPLSLIKFQLNDSFHFLLSFAWWLVFFHSVIFFSCSYFMFNANWEFCVCNYAFNNLANTLQWPNLNHFNKNQTFNDNKMIRKNKIVIHSSKNENKWAATKSRRNRCRTNL